MLYLDTYHTLNNDQCKIDQSLPQFENAAAIGVDLLLRQGRYLSKDFLLK